MYAINVDYLAAPEWAFRAIRSGLVTGLAALLSTQESVALKSLVS